MAGLMVIALTTYVNLRFNDLAESITLYSIATNHNFWLTVRTIGLMLYIFEIHFSYF